MDDLKEGDRVIFFNTYLRKENCWDDSGEFTLVCPEDLMLYCGFVVLIEPRCDLVHVYSYLSTTVIAIKYSEYGKKIFHTDKQAKDAMLKQINSMFDRDSL